MTNTAFSGLPQQIQQIVLEGIDAEVETTLERIREAERATPVNPALLGSLKSDVDHARSLRDQFTNGQA